MAMVSSPSRRSPRLTKHQHRPDPPPKAAARQGVDGSTGAPSPRGTPLENKNNMERGGSPDSAEVLPFLSTPSRQSRPPSYVPRDKEDWAKTNTPSPNASRRRAYGRRRATISPRTRGRAIAGVLASPGDFAGEVGARAGKKFVPPSDRSSAEATLHRVARAMRGKKRPIDAGPGEGDGTQMKRRRRKAASDANEKFRGIREDDADLDALLSEKIPYKKPSGKKAKAVSANNDDRPCSDANVVVIIDGMGEAEALSAGTSARSEDGPRVTVDTFKPKGKTEERWFRNFKKWSSAQEAKAELSTLASPLPKQWAKNQRREYRLLHENKKSQLTQDRIVLMENAGFLWQPSAGRPKVSKSLKDVQSNDVGKKYEDYAGVVSEGNAAEMGGTHAKSKPASETDGTLEERSPKRKSRRMSCPTQFYHNLETGKSSSNQSSPSKSAGDTQPQKKRGSKRTSCPTQFYRNLRTDKSSKNQMNPSKTKGDKQPQKVAEPTAPAPASVVSRDGKQMDPKEKALPTTIAGSLASLSAKVFAKAMSEKKSHGKKIKRRGRLNSSLLSSLPTTMVNVTKKDKNGNYTHKELEKEMARKKRKPAGKKSASSNAKDKKAGMSKPKILSFNTDEGTVQNGEKSGGASGKDADGIVDTTIGKPASAIAKEQKVGKPQPKVAAASDEDAGNNEEKSSDSDRKEAGTPMSDASPLPAKELFFASPPSSPNLDRARILLNIQPDPLRKSIEEISESVCVEKLMLSCLSEDSTEKEAQLSQACSAPKQPAPPPQLTSEPSDEIADIHGSDSEMSGDSQAKMANVQRNDVQPTPVATEQAGEKTPEKLQEKSIEAPSQPSSWTCDVCHEATFDDYDEALAHEKECASDNRDQAEDGEVSVDNDRPERLMEKSDGYCKDDKSTAKRNLAEEHMFPSTEDLGPASDDKETKNWTCDVCQEATFGNYEEAVAHERLCSGAAGSPTELSASKEREGEPFMRGDTEDQSVAHERLCSVAVDSPTELSASEEREGEPFVRGDTEDQSGSLQKGSVCDTTNPRLEGTDTVPEASHLQSNGDQMSSWTCDICQKATFHDFEEAADHEKTCAGKSSTYSSSVVERKEAKTPNVYEPSVEHEQPIGGHSVSSKVNSPSGTKVGDRQPHEQEPTRPQEAEDQIPDIPLNRNGEPPYYPARAGNAINQNKPQPADSPAVHKAVPGINQTPEAFRDPSHAWPTPLHNNGQIDGTSPSSLFSPLSLTSPLQENNPSTWGYSTHPPEPHDGAAMMLGDGAFSPSHVENAHAWPPAQPPAQPPEPSTAGVNTTVNLNLNVPNFNFAVPGGAAHMNDSRLQLILAEGRYREKMAEVGRLALEAKMVTQQMSIIEERMRSANSFPAAGEGINGRELREKSFSQNSKSASMRRSRITPRDQESLGSDSSANDEEYSEEQTLRTRRKRRDHSSSRQSKATLEVLGKRKKASWSGSDKRSSESHFDSKSGSMQRSRTTPRDQESLGSDSSANGTLEREYSEEQTFRTRRKRREHSSSGQSKATLEVSEKRMKVSRSGNDERSRESHSGAKRSSQWSRRGNGSRSQRPNVLKRQDQQFNDGHSSHRAKKRSQGNTTSMHSELESPCSRKSPRARRHVGDSLTAGYSSDDASFHTSDHREKGRVEERLPCPPSSRKAKKIKPSGSEGSEGDRDGKTQRTTTIGEGTCRNNDDAHTKKRTPERKDPNQVPLNSQPVQANKSKENVKEHNGKDEKKTVPQASQVRNSLYWLAGGEESSDDESWDFDGPMILPPPPM